MTDRQDEEALFSESGPDRDLGFDLFGRLRLQNRQLREELLELHRRHVELMREHIELLEAQNRTRKPFDAAERKRVIELARSGMGATNIAAELGRPVGSISGEIHRARQRGELPNPYKE